MECRANNPLINHVYVQEGRIAQAKAAEENARKKEEYEAKQKQLQEGQGQDSGINNIYHYYD